MKTLTKISCAILFGTFLAAAPTGFGGDQPGQQDPKAPKPKPYPLTTCLVSGEKLGEMGKPYEIVYQNRQIKFCCKGCVKDFKKEPEKFLKKLAEAEKKAK